MRLLAKAEEAGGVSQARGGAGLPSSQARQDEAVAQDEDEEPASPRPAKRARKSRGGVEALSREELLGRALLLLEQSFRVAEKGIAGGRVGAGTAVVLAATGAALHQARAGCERMPTAPSPAAIDVDMEALEGMPDIAAASTNTVNAWKRLQINTASQLGRLHAAAGREEQARKMDADVQASKRPGCIACFVGQCLLLCIGSCSALHAHTHTSIHPPTRRRCAGQGVLPAQPGADGADVGAAAPGAGARAGGCGPPGLPPAPGGGRRVSWAPPWPLWSTQQCCRRGCLHGWSHFLPAPRSPSLPTQVCSVPLGRRGFVRWGMTDSAAGWLAELEGSYRDAQEEEERELEGQEGTVKHLLGTRVAAALDDLEKRLHGELTQLDRFVGEHHAEAAHRRLLREQHRWDANAATAAAAGGEQALLSGGVALLWELLHTLPDFRRKTLVVQHVVMFSEHVAQEAERKQQEAERRKQEQAAAKAAASAAGAEAGPAAEVEMVDVDAAGQQAGAVPPAADPQQLLRQQEQEDSEALAALLHAAEGGQAFVGSSGWRGRVPGYVFKLGGSGLGYYRDAPPQVEAFLTLGRVSRLAVVLCALGPWCKAAGLKGSWKRPLKELVL